MQSETTIAGQVPLSKVKVPNPLALYSKISTHLLQKQKRRGTCLVVVVMIMLFGC